MPLKAPLEKEHTYKGRLAHYAEEYGWCFCVGAGVSRGMFRDWNELAEGLVREVLPDLKPADIKIFADAQRPEALIQAAVNLGEGKSNREILTRLSEFFFSGLRAKAGKACHCFEIAGFPRRTYFWTLPVAIFGSSAYRPR
jgi:hypothetical protein